MISLSTFRISSEIGNITSHGIKTGHGVLNVADASCSVATSMQMGWLLHCTEVHLSTLALCFYHHLLIKWIPYQ
ncbi:hypothetical protein SETIT_6G140700v2 [Setaria italica]|uniref:Uncharacterized protein n=1 Tax=Setaria italica TaxID=4555 RepID=A0A368RLL1_SETIT|nr:hypothetical protein SETIT_6G140700v2 [Setaria italica]